MTGITTAVSCDEDWRSLLKRNARSPADPMRLDPFRPLAAPLSYPSPYDPWSATICINQYLETFTDPRELNLKPSSKFGIKRLES